MPDNIWEVQAYGKCHRKNTALIGKSPIEVRVKWCGKSAPHYWQQEWQGKPHLKQDQIEEHKLIQFKMWSASFLGRLLEVFSDKHPRGMIASSECIHFDRQNPAYRSTSLPIQNCSN